MTFLELSPGKFVPTAMLQHDDFTNGGWFVADIFWLNGTVCPANRKVSPFAIFCENLRRIIRKVSGTSKYTMLMGNVRSILNARRFEGSAGDQRLNGDLAPHVELASCPMHTLCVCVLQYPFHLATNIELIY